MQVVWAERSAGKREMQRDQSNGSIRCKRRDASIAGTEHEVTPRRHTTPCRRLCQIHPGHQDSVVLTAWRRRRNVRL